MMSPRNFLVKLWLNYLLKHTASLNDGVEIRAEGSMDEWGIDLRDSPLAEIIANFDIAFVRPGRARFFKTGMEQRDKQLPSLF